jgi:hypothetical protein
VGGGGLAGVAGTAVWVGGNGVEVGAGVLIWLFAWDWLLATVGLSEVVGVDWFGFWQAARDPAVANASCLNISRRDTVFFIEVSPDEYDILNDKEQTTGTLYVLGIKLMTD